MDQLPLNHLSNSVSKVFDVLVFDSGVGGLSITQELCRQLPNLSYLYLADHAAFPYGTKEADWLISRIEQVTQHLLDLYQVNVIVMACNTASTLVLPKLRSRFQIPVVGVVPAIKTAGSRSQKRAVGILATPGTIAREYTQELIDQFATDCRIIRVGSSRLVEMAELKLRGMAIDQNELNLILSPFFLDGQPQVDVVVLGCTHFPLLKAELEKVSPLIQWIDSGEAIARRVAEVYIRREQDSNDNRPRNLFLLTQNLSDLEEHTTERNLIDAQNQSTSELSKLSDSLARFGFLEAEILRL